MKRKILPVLIASLALGASPLGLLSASAQDAAPILPKKGATQGEQPQSGTSQQPSGGESQGSGSNQQAPSGGTEGDATQPDSGKTDKSGSSSQKGTDQPSTQQQGTTSTQQQDTTKPADGSSSQSKSSSGSESGKSSTESGKSSTKSSGDASSTEGNTKSGASGSTDTQTTGSTSTETNTSNVNISVEQKTEIRQVVKEVNVEPVRDVDFTVSVGTVIPKKVHLEPVPTRIVKLVPQYDGYRFFILADGRIVIVEPSSFKIVYIIV